tara:strand:+ start:114 stop:368 length:255 start_codon:yes stop_codon:yes gene_type:complete
MTEKEITQERKKLVELIEKYESVFSSYMKTLENLPDQKEVDSILGTSETLLMLRKQMKTQLEVFDFVLGVNNDYEMNFKLLNIT